MNRFQSIRRTARYTAFALCLICASFVYAQKTAVPKTSSPQEKPKAGGAQPKPAPTPPPKSETIEDDEVLRVETELISVPTVVTDRNGKPLTNLRAANFAVFEDGVPQQIENFAAADTPFEIALLLDTSGSTRSELGLIQRAADAFIKALRPGDRVAIIAFKSEIFDGRREAVVDVLTDLTDDRAELQAAVERARTSGGTPLYEALDQIADRVFSAAPTPELRGRRAIVALTDGVDSTSAIEFADARERIGERGLAAYFIELNTEDSIENRVLGDCEDETSVQFSKTQLRRYRKMIRPRPGGERSSFVVEDFCDMGQFERLDISRKLYRLARYEMEQLAKNTGGKTFPVEDLREARVAFAQVAAEIGTQYSLGYYSNNQKKDGGFRKIRVELRGLPAGAQVKAREGYSAEK